MTLLSIKFMTPQWHPDSVGKFIKKSPIVFETRKYSSGMHTVRLPTVSRCIGGGGGGG